jgi:hypothetical protein
VRILMIILTFAFLGSCSSTSHKDKFFLSKNDIDRSSLNKISHYGDYFVYFDRNKKIAFGYSKKFKHINQKKFHLKNEKADYKSFDFGAMCKIGNYCGNLNKLCAREFFVKDIDNFDSVFKFLRHSGYPIYDMTYLGPNENGRYKIDFSYFTDCEYIESDKDYIFDLFRTEK